MNCFYYFYFYFFHFQYAILLALLLIAQIIIGALVLAYQDQVGMQIFSFTFNFSEVFRFIMESMTH